MADKKTGENATSKAITKEFLDAVFRMPRFTTAWFAFSFLPLLFIRNLGQTWYQIFMPAIVVYGIGAALFGTFHRLIAISYEKPREVIKKLDEKSDIEEHIYIYTNNESTIPVLGRIGLYLAHLSWFVVFVWYLNYRGIISI